MRLEPLVTNLALHRPKQVIAGFVIFTITLVVLAGLPTFWPGTFSSLQPLKIDTDPENMLPADAPVRVFHHKMKARLALHDMIVVGVVNEQHPQGVFNRDSLKKVYELTEFAKGLQWRYPVSGATEGVVRQDIIAPSLVDNIEQGGPGEIKFEWLMRTPPETPAAAEAVRDKARNIPFLDGTLVSEDGKALAVYLPITQKDVSSKIYESLQGKIAELGGPEQFHITGLPVAEDVFGVEMFKQMAISAPVAMIIIFLLLWFFFKRAFMAAPPIIDSLIAALSTMGLLVATGNTVHIMSSMIPIFIVPIAVLDDVHVLSEFFDRYPSIGDREKTLRVVMRELFVPMLYTTITTAVGFASLALAPIPPVQVFGLFVAFGVIVAWLCSILIVPSLIMLLPARVLENYGTHGEEGGHGGTPLGKILGWLGRFTYTKAMPIISFFIILTGISLYGITQIRINDNPIKWFTPDHPIRIADRVLNSHFGGTYMAYLALSPAGEELEPTTPAGDEFT